MREVEERYISLLADFGFKLIFGMVPNKDLLIYFLNSLFDGRKVIKGLEYNNPELVGDMFPERKDINVILMTDRERCVRPIASCLYVQ